MSNFNEQGDIQSSSDYSYNMSYERELQKAYSDKFQTYLVVVDNCVKHHFKEFKDCEISIKNQKFVETHFKNQNYSIIKKDI